MAHETGPKGYAQLLSAEKRKRSQRCCELWPCSQKASIANQESLVLLYISTNKRKEREGFEHTRTAELSNRGKTAAKTRNKGGSAKISASTGRIRFWPGTASAIHALRTARRNNVGPSLSQVQKERISDQCRGARAIRSTRDIAIAKIKGIVVLGFQRRGGGRRGCV